MQGDQEVSCSSGEQGDLRASNGEVVRRTDLDRAAGTPGRFVSPNPTIAGYDGVDLARAALAGDQAALDEFHRRVGLAIPRVTEYCEESVVRLIVLETDRHGKPRAAFQATNQGGHDCTRVDADDLIAWILSSDGRAALARRGIVLHATCSDPE